MFKNILIAITISLCTFTTANASAPAKETKAQLKQDEKTLEFLLVLNNNEIKAAKQVLKSNPEASVSEYAQYLVTEHTTLLGETKNLVKKIGKPKKSVISSKLLLKGQAELATLKVLSDEKAAKAYIDNMVADHEEGLKVIDSEILPNVTHAELKEHVEMTRMHIAAHLEKAKEIQAKLQQEG